MCNCHDFVPIPKYDWSRNRTSRQPKIAKIEDLFTVPLQQWAFIMTEYLSTAWQRDYNLKRPVLSSQDHFTIQVFLHFILPNQ